MVTKNEYINDILALHFSGEKLTEKQEKDLIDWVCENRSEYKRLSELITATGSVQQITFDSERAWQNVSRHMRKKREFRLNPALRYISYAACMVLVMGISLFFLNKKDEVPVSFMNATDHLMAVLLPDSTAVTLYPEAKIDYWTATSSNERRTSLKGKAYFKVKRNEKQPFVVDHRNAMIRVLGTSFLVSSTDSSETSVFVREGKVQVSAEGKNVILNANEKAVVSDHTLSKAPIKNPATLFSPYIPKKEYKDALLTKVVQDIEQEFNVKIEVSPSLQEARITTTINYLNLEDILSEICYICSGNYSQKNDRLFRIDKNQQ